MPDTPPPMDREKLAEQFSALKHFIQNRNDLTDTRKYTIQNTLDTMEAFASAWLDREVKKATESLLRERNDAMTAKSIIEDRLSKLEYSITEEIKKGVADTNHEMLVEALTVAMDAERERCAKIAESYHAKWEDYEEPSPNTIAAAIRSTPGQVFSKSWAEQALKDEEGHDISAGPEIYPLGKPGQEPK